MLQVVCDNLKCVYIKCHWWSSRPCNAGSKLYVHISIQVWPVLVHFQWHCLWYWQKKRHKIIFTCLFPQHTMADLGTSRHGRKRMASHRLSEGKTTTQKGKRSKADTSAAPPSASDEPSPASTGQPELTASWAAPVPPRADTAAPVPSDLNVLIQEAIKNQLQSAGLLPNTTQPSQPLVQDPSSCNQPQLPAPPQPPASKQHHLPTNIHGFRSSPLHLSIISIFRLLHSCQEWLPTLTSNNIVYSQLPQLSTPTRKRLPHTRHRQLTTWHRFPAAPSRTVTSNRRIRSAPCPVCPVTTVSPCAALWENMELQSRAVKLQCVSSTLKCHQVLWHTFLFELSSTWYTKGSSSFITYILVGVVINTLCVQVTCFNKTTLHSMCDNVRQLRNFESRALTGINIICLFSMHVSNKQFESWRWKKIYMLPTVHPSVHFYTLLSAYFYTLQPHLYICTLLHVFCIFALLLRTSSCALQYSLYHIYCHTWSI